MKINFNNVRAQACFAYDRLVKKLNSSIIKEDQYAKPNECNREVNIKGHILIDAEDIQKDMESLRQTIGTIAMTYEEGNDDFKDVFEEKYPEPKSMAIFNPEDDE